MTVQIKRLSWAGVEITVDHRRLLVDALQSVAPLESFLGHPHWPLAVIERTPGRTDALITHLHHDHFDPETLHDLLGEEGIVYCHQPVNEIILRRTFERVLCRKKSAFKHKSEENTT